MTKSLLSFFILVLFTAQLHCQKWLKFIEKDPFTSEVSFHLGSPAKTYESVWDDPNVYFVQDGTGTRFYIIGAPIRLKEGSSKILIKIGSKEPIEGVAQVKRSKKSTTGNYIYLRELQEMNTMKLSSVFLAEELLKQEQKKYEILIRVIDSSNQEYNLTIPSQRKNASLIREFIEFVNSN